MAVIIGMALMAFGWYMIGQAMNLIAIGWKIVVKYFMD